ncbi:MAG: transporter [Betaproteobacteria bacterium]
MLALTASLAAAQDDRQQPPTARQSLDDAWWTGPMLAPSAATLPRGHILIEPYVYDVAADARFDGNGKRRGAARSETIGSLAYILYGLTNSATVGLIPTVGFNKVSNGPSSSGLGLGDLTLHAEYALTRFHARSWIPATAIVLQETCPTGKYDRLGDRPSNGLGSGAYTTTLALFSQKYFWLPNGRILRMRFDVSQSVSGDVGLHDVSVYGTPAGFHGHASPGGSFLADAAWEYSLRRSWVLAVDVMYRHDGNTRVTADDAAGSTGAGDPAAVRLDSGSREAFGVAPAIEYSWSPNVGVLLGARVIAGGRNTAATITPAVAINFVH